jgi:hypothetical protein
MGRLKLFRQEFTPDITDWYPEILEQVWNKSDMICTVRALAPGFAIDVRARNYTFPPVKTWVAKCPFLGVFAEAFHQGF